MAATSRSSKDRDQEVHQLRSCSHLVTQLSQQYETRSKSGCKRVGAEITRAQTSADDRAALVRCGWLIWSIEGTAAEERVRWKLGIEKDFPGIAAVLKTGK